MLEHEHQEPESTAQTIRQVVRFLRVLWHRRIIVMGTLVLCGMLGGLYYATATRIYEAEAQLLVVDTSRESSPTSMTGSHSDVAAMATYEKLVSSPLVLQSAATLLDAPIRNLFGSQDPEVLADDPDFVVRDIRVGHRLLPLCLEVFADLRHQTGSSHRPDRVDRCIEQGQVACFSSETAFSSPAHPLRHLVCAKPTGRP